MTYEFNENNISRILCKYFIHIRNDNGTYIVQKTLKTYSFFHEWL